MIFGDLFKYAQDIIQFDFKEPGFDYNRQNSFSSINSPAILKSPPLSDNNPFFNNSKFSFSDSSTQQASPQPYSPSFGNKNFRKSSFPHKNSNFNNQSGTPNSTGAYSSSNSFENETNDAGFANSKYQQNRNFSQQQQGVSLFIKANNVTEDLLRSLFSANVSQAKILSIDVKIK
jgi:hypothetical protein